MARTFDIEVVERGTREVLKSDIRVLQTHYFADSAEAHVSYLLRFFSPPYGAKVIDAGCGFGEVSRLMKQERPDLDFILANISPLQLSHCPPQMSRVQADCHALPIADSSVDAVMFHSALCNMDAPEALTEAWRVLRPGGVLFLNDLCRSSGANKDLERVLYATAYYPIDLDRVIRRAGFRVERAEFPRHDTKHFRAQFGDEALYSLLFKDVHPVLVKAIKESA